MTMKEGNDSLFLDYKKVYKPQTPWRSVIEIIIIDGQSRTKSPSQNIKALHMKKKKEIDNGGKFDEGKSLAHVVENHTCAPQS